MKPKLTKKNTPFTWLLLVLLAPIGMRGQSLTLENVVETRSTFSFFSGFFLNVRLNGLDIGPERQIRLWKAHAIDDQGNRLEFVPWPTSRSYADSDQLSVEFELPQRSAKILKKVAISISLFTPSEATRSKLHFTDILQKVNTNLLEDYYDNIKLMPVDSLTYEKIKQQSKEGIEGFDPRSMADQSLTELAPDHSVYFALEDPDFQILQMNFYDATGALKNYGYDRNQLYWQHTLEEAIQNDWTLELIINNEAANRVYSFELLDVELH